jgi:hypothetical protein
MAAFLDDGSNKHFWNVGTVTSLHGATNQKAAVFKKMLAGWSVDMKRLFNCTGYFK